MSYYLYFLFYKFFHIFIIEILFVTFISQVFAYSYLQNSYLDHFIQEQFHLHTTEVFLRSQVIKHEVLAGFEKFR